MARNSVVTQQIVHTGVAPTATSPNAEGDIIDTGNVFLLVSNIGVGSVTVTVEAQAKFDGLAVTNLGPVSVAAGATKAIGPLATVTFGFPAGDVNQYRAFVDYTGTPADIKRSVLSF